MGQTVPSTDFSHLAENLRLCRLVRRMTQRELAGQAGLSQAYVCRLEHGLWPSQPEHVERLAKALNATPSVLLHRPEEDSGGSHGARRGARTMSPALSIPKGTLRGSHAVCDVDIAAFRDSEKEFRERVANLEADVRAYRALALQAIHCLHDRTKECDRLHVQNSELRNELLRLRDSGRRVV